MARGTGTVTVKFLGDTSGLKKAADDASDQLSGVGSKIGSMAKSALMVGVPALTAFGVEAVKQFSESQKVAAQTEAVLKSTHGSSKMTAQGIGDLADSLSKMSGTDDEAIQSGENLLLTFTNIQNKAGKGNDIFSQATATMLDMSTALGQDTSTSAIQLGKALNDPIKGVTALQRVGVSFTEDQQKQIKALVESGHTMDAQKIILKELQTEFGGSAKAAGDTFAGQVNKLKVAFGNFMEDVGAKIVPALMNLGKWLGENVPKAIQTLQPYFDRLSDAAKTMAGWFMDNVVPALEKIASFVQDNMGPVLAGLAVIVGVALVAAVWSLVTAIGALFSPFVLIVAAFALVAAGVVYAYQHFEVFRDVVDAVVSFFKDKVAPAIGAVASWIGEQFGNLTDWVRDHWGQISEAIDHIMNVIKGVIQAGLDVIMGLWHAWGDDLANFVGVWVNGFKEAVNNAMELIRGVINTVLALINGDWGEAWDGIKQVVGAVWDQMRSSIDTAIGLIKSLLGGFVSTIESLAKTMWQPIADGFKTAVNWVIGRWNGLEFKAPHLPGLPDVTIGVPDIPLLASGGTFSGAAIVGEAGPELLVGSGRVIPNSQLGGSVVINFYGPQDPAGVARQIEDLLTSYKRQGGVLRFT